nr:immunoglobulin heavy chain junction region [Macaca mulatta]MOW19225.1 immunoglobulin heavy chain junction region [Macaca mulatta]MOW20114.1 immunoglobulin heavy chain junction region [Macaca mulatta]MOW21514.1 immunoglobulin heavy chain junction region [Macaca mulatta]MOW21533.1 immunoglobulin heavy chain junction region [Macaca mulatta]
CVRGRRLAPNFDSW